MVTFRKLLFLLFFSIRTFCFATVDPFILNGDMSRQFPCDPEANEYGNIKNHDKTNLPSSNSM